ncbi:unnamed protein product, partial [Adineta ricciae]
QLGTSAITHGTQQDLILNPGVYSVDPNEDSFDASNWKYSYYCRVYDLYNFPNIGGVLLTIENSQNDPNNPSCLTNRTDNGSGLRFENSTDSPNSSLTILAGSLQQNQTYQFLVILENKINSSIQMTGYLLVQIVTTTPPFIALGCVISSLCSSNGEFQLVNPTTQLSLFTLCIGTCTNIQSIYWNIYQSSFVNSTQWTLFNQTHSYENIWFFARKRGLQFEKKTTFLYENFLLLGINTSNITTTSDLFINNPQINLWKFEVVYTFLSTTSTSALSFIRNQSPYNGSCSISPLNGTITTVFTISCSNWIDVNVIKDYSLYIWTNDISKRIMIAYSSISSFQVRFPTGINETSFVNVIIDIRNLQNCITQMNLTSVYVQVDSESINDLINNLQNSSNLITNNPIVQLLSSQNTNVVGQILISICQQLNMMNNQYLNEALSNGIPLATISVSPLGSEYSDQNFISSNETALNEFNLKLNRLANAIDYLIIFLTELPITTINNLLLQSSTFAQLTQSTNQLTRATLTIASNRCYQLSLALSSLAGQIPYEYIQTAANQLLQCTTNVLTAVNGPIQGRTNVLDLDLSRSNPSSNSYDTDLEAQLSNLNLFGSNEDLIEKNRNLYYQKQLSNEIISQSNKIISLITSSLKIYMNTGQSFSINTSQTYMFLETISIGSIADKIIKQIGNAQFHFPSDFIFNITNNSSSISLRSKMDPLAPYGNFSNTNLSNTVSLTILDENGNDISLKVNETNEIRIIIPRDTNFVLSSMNLQNVTSMNSTKSKSPFNFHYVNIKSSLSISLHFEIQPINATPAYLFIYKFDQTPQLNSSIYSLDGWTLFCPSNLTIDHIYKYFLDNQQTSSHQSFIFGLRELNSTEMNISCSNNTLPITDEQFQFTTNYQLRIYTSGCYYLDENNNWKSDGVRVGSLTNHNETECYSTHLTSFAGGFLVLPNPINWNYVFANASFSKNPTIYLTIIITSLFYIILMIYSRYKDKKDIEKLGVTPLIDNEKSDEYYYEILVFTGQRRNAGTESKVQFVLSGENDQTNVRLFSDSHRKLFQRGGIDAFIMSVPKSLGLLNYLRIWHDNSGQGDSASWFLKYVIVRDLQTMDKSYFICQRWFAVEKDDGKIERTIPVAGGSEQKEFSYILSKTAYRNVSETHLWFSIFSRPPSNRFTRTQRCTCCFVLLFAAMVINIMYYDLSSAANSSNQTQSAFLSFGPIYITSQQIGIGIMSELLTFLPSLLIVQFFRRIRPHRHISPLRQALHQMKSSRPISATDVKVSERFVFEKFPYGASGSIFD